MTEERIDLGVVLSLAHVTFLSELARHMEAAGFVGFTTRYGAVLRFLQAAPVSLRELATQLEMTSPGALKLVSAMTEAGYLERTPAATDRRVRLVAVSERGHQALAAARQFHAALEDDLARTLGADAVKGARAVLEHLAARETGVVPPALRRAAGGL